MPTAITFIMSTYPIEKTGSQQDVEFQEDEKTREQASLELPEIDKEIEKRYESLTLKTGQALTKV